MPQSSLSNALVTALTYATFLLCLATSDGKTAQTSESWSGCYATFDSNRLTIGNQKIELSFRIEEGYIEPDSLLNKGSSQQISLASNKKSFTIQAEDSPSPSLRISAAPKKMTHSESFLSVDVVSDFEGYSVNRRFRIYPNSRLIACDQFVKGSLPSIPKPEDTRFFAAKLPGHHWKIESVEFFDKTDHINNLVRKTSLLAYAETERLRGNLLLARNLDSGFSLLILKEAPASISQRAYPGYDFAIDIKRGLTLPGSGIDSDFSFSKEWIQIYGYAIGVSDEPDGSSIRALRDYQNRIRQRDPQSDDKILMNTWGDRNGDININEAFILKQIDACARLGIDILQIDDGWQTLLSKNTAFDKSESPVYWNQWPPEAWEPHPDKFPKGFAPILQRAREAGVEIGLWFHPSNEGDYQQWDTDADAVANLYHKYGIRYFKIDGVKLPNSQSEANFRKFLSAVLERSNNEIYFNLDLTDNVRGGYHYLYEYGGNIFLENRFTEFLHRYYPHQTLRNLWQLAEFFPPQKLQIEFLNTFRKREKYSADSHLSPSNIPFEYQFAITMVAQPLAWLEAANLPEEGFAIAPMIETYKNHREELHNQDIFPIGEEPSGEGWTGFQSLSNNEGYILLFRENSPRPQERIKLFAPPNAAIKLEPIMGKGTQKSVSTNEYSEAYFKLPTTYSYSLYKYTIE